MNAPGCSGRNPSGPRSSYTCGSCPTARRQAVARGVGIAAVVEGEVARVGGAPFWSTRSRIITVGSQCAGCGSADAVRTYASVEGECSAGEGPEVRVAGSRNVRNSVGAEIRAAREHVGTGSRRWALPCRRRAEYFGRPAGVDADHWTTLGSPARSRPAGNSRPGARKVGVVGRLAPENVPKGSTRLLRSLTQRPYKLCLSLTW